MTQPTSRRVRQAERAQQRELRAPPRDRERLRRENEHAAGEQRDQREHVEIDAIRARQPRGGGHAGLAAVLTTSTGRQQCLQRVARARRVGARASRRSMRVSRPRDRERILDGGDVHHRISAPPGCRPDIPATRSATSRRPAWTSTMSPSRTPSHCAAAALGNSVSPRSASRRSRVAPTSAGLIAPRETRRRLRASALRRDRAHRDVDFDDRARDGDAVDARERPDRALRRNRRAARAPRDRHCRTASRARRRARSPPRD